MLFCWLLVCCGNETGEETSIQTTTIDTLRFGLSKENIPSLSTGLQKVIENWSVYPEFSLEVAQFQNMDLEALKLRSAKLASLTDSLSNSIPDTLFTEPIQSRLVILKTRSQLLQQEAGKNNIDPKAIENQISETNKAIKNFVIQLNEKLQKDAIDMQRIDNEKKELEKQRKFLDSVYQAELKDQNN